MFRQRWMKLVVLAAVSILSGAQAQPSGAGMEFGCQLEQSAEGRAVFRSTIEVPSAGQWLGVTFYPEKFDRVPEKGIHHLVALKRGRTISDLAIEAGAIHGTFEAAVWNRRIARASCAATDLLCQTQGFRLDGMTAYMWGVIP